MKKNHSDQKNQLEKQIKDLQIEGKTQKAQIEKLEKEAIETKEKSKKETEEAKTIHDKVISELNEANSLISKLKEDA